MLWFKDLCIGLGLGSWLSVWIKDLCTGLGLGSWLSVWVKDLCIGWDVGEKTTQAVGITTLLFSAFTVVHCTVPTLPISVVYKSWADTLGS